MKNLIPILLMGCISPLEAENSSIWEHPSREISKLVPLGTGFEFKIKQDFKFMREPSLPLTVEIVGKSGLVYSMTVGAGTSYDLSCELKPGRYMIRTEPADKTKYWGCTGGYLTVEDDGTSSIWTQHITLRLKMTPISPVDLIETNEVRPTLNWKPIQGAVKYRITWFEHDSKTREVLNRGDATVDGVTNWTFGFDLVSDRTYEWAVDAEDELGERFAYYSASYFKTK